MGSRVCSVWGHLNSAEWLSVPRSLPSRDEDSHPQSCHPANSYRHIGISNKVQGRLEITFWIS